MAALLLILALSLAFDIVAAFVYLGRWVEVTPGAVAWTLVFNVAGIALLVTAAFGGVTP